MGLLVDRLPIRRSKKRIRDKIVELRLVDNVTELRKKRSSKKKDKKAAGRTLESHLEEGPEPPWDRDDSSSSSEGESSGDESDDGSSAALGKRRRKLYGFSQLNVTSFDPEALVDAINQLMDEGTHSTTAPLCFVFLFSCDDY